MATRRANMHRVFLFGMLLVGSVMPGYSQLVSVGVKAGVPLNDTLTTANSVASGVSTNTDRWLVGPTAEVHLPFRISLEVDALYRRESYTLTGTNQSNNINNWQFPFLAKYDFRGEVLRPFVDAGATYQHLSGAGSISDPNRAGFTAGAGLTVKLLFLRLSPEVRYTRWGSSSLINGATAMQTQNQADFLVGFTF